MKTAQQPAGVLVGSLVPAPITKDRPELVYHKPRRIWKGKVWLLLKPYQRLQILKSVATYGPRGERGF